MAVSAPKVIKSGSTNGKKIFYETCVLPEKIAFYGTHYLRLVKWHYLCSQHNMGKDYSKLTLYQLILKILGPRYL